MTSKILVKIKYSNQNGEITTEEVQWDSDCTVIDLKGNINSIEGTKRIIEFIE